MPAHLRAGRCSRLWAIAVPGTKPLLLLGVPGARGPWDQGTSTGTMEQARGPWRPARKLSRESSAPGELTRRRRKRRGSPDAQRQR
ncbi:hypothetical protein NDU88_002229 [Pleurodeles waltl]|uniref:Uncharacterized protein n=1 Tax=Pleurodeles waltl TaxID=8319 RepID=A0AAV7UY37_PLEWA|nr:hypothetical protein NDU88_002229 [Pleurodeles waltl]